MENNFKRFTITEQEMLEHPICKKNEDDDKFSSAFYPFIAEKANLDTTGMYYDCRHIDVSENIQDYWFEYMRGFNIPDADFAMFLLMRGPKVNSELPDFTFEIDNEFLVPEEEN